MRKARKIHKAIVARIPLVLLFVLFIAMYFTTAETNPGAVVKEGSKTYIVDRLGERWDVTQAESLGFDPEGFEFGLGRNAFTPLNDSLLTDDTWNVSNSTRVIGVAQGSRAQAYTISRLLSHEVSNSIIGSDPVAVSY
jgi:hypothetical protein